MFTAEGSLGCLPRLPIALGRLIEFDVRPAITIASYVFFFVDCGTILRKHLSVTVSIRLGRIFFLLLIVGLLSPTSGVLPQRADSQRTVAPKPSTKRPSAPKKERADVAAFRKRVDAALAATGAEKGYWGVLVTDAASGEVLYALNAQRYFTPASNTKMFTTALALATLGPAFRFHTTLETRGTVDNAGRLNGDLVLTGRGDPNLSNRKFPFDRKEERDGPADKVIAELADALVAHGVKEIEGDVIADDSYFDYERFPSGWAIDDLLWSYGAAVSALCINDNTITLALRPGENEGAPAAIDSEPWDGFYKIQNEIRTVAAGAESKLAIAREPGSRVIVLRGALPLNSDPVKRTLAIEEPAEYAAALLRRLLEERGVRISGEARARHTPDATPGAPTVLAEHVSLPLSEDVRLLNKTSQNLHAELLLRVSARQALGTTSTEAALKFVQDFLKNIGIAENDVLLWDGSGLSRRNLVTPEAAVRLLAWTAQQPWGELYRSTFPVGGEDGTLSDRMKTPPLLDRIQAKTGSLGHVNALSGYATSVHGERLIFSMFGNNLDLRGHAATDVFDAICTAMVEELGAKPPAKKKKQPRLEKK
jgi:D-alanyl-D-alanine carboxypeptidase/D-alanyl-D-alanine-endopeptidase (penicillin-binding protein 4)